MIHIKGKGRSIFHISSKEYLVNMIKAKQIKYNSNFLIKHWSFMMIGIIHIKKFNNVIQILYYILYYTFMKKTNIQLQSQIRELTILLLYQIHKSQVYLFYVVSKKL